MREIRVEENTEMIMNSLDRIQENVEKLCPFGSMIKILYKDNTQEDTWFSTNREEVETGHAKLLNFMAYFEDATANETPIIIKDIFTLDYQKETP